MKSVYVIHVDLLDEMEKPFNEMTDEEVIALCKTDKDCENHDWFESVEDFAAAFNTEECFSQNMPICVLLMTIRTASPSQA